MEEKNRFLLINNFFYDIIQSEVRERRLAVKDCLCLIPQKHIIHDKSYCNLTEFALRTEAVRVYLCNSGAERKLCDGKGSDYDVLYQLVEAFKRNGDESSRVYKYFSRVLRNCFEIDANDVILERITTEELWHNTAEKLLKRENSLLGIISRSEIDSIGVAQTPWEYEALPDKIGNTKIKSVLCPLGVCGKSILEIPGFDDLAMLEDHISRLVSPEEECAIFLDSTHLEFEEPNLYAASRAYDKMKKSVTLKDSERRILKTQLLRDTLFACAQNGRELMLVLPTAVNIKMLYQTEQLLDYIDECLRPPIKLTLFATDASGFAFASATAAKRYKKITAEAAVGGVDCYLMDESEIKYWGVGRIPERTASLAATPALFGKIIC